jgi:MFS family permease
VNVRLITAGVVLTNFLVALEATVVSTAAPTIVQDLGGMSLYAWVFTAYMITVTVSGPIWGKLSDLYGRRRIYLVSVALFLAGSALSGQAHSMAWLIGFRALQGLGGGALTPLGQTVLAEI